MVLTAIEDLVEEVETPNAIMRDDLKRTALIYADIAPESGLTPLTAADRLERDVFPGFTKKYPTSTLAFTGEVEDSRRSGGEIVRAVGMVLILIYVILVLLFNSLSKPLLIMISIPFALVGIVFAFLAHGMAEYGFFAAIGAIGLAGVVINDAIIMLVKLSDEFDQKADKSTWNRQVADIAQTRLRAVTLTTVTTVAGMLPTAYGFAGYDAMLAQMMLAMSWGLMFGTLITLVLIPCLFRLLCSVRRGTCVHSHA